MEHSSNREVDKSPAARAKPFRDVDVYKLRRGPGLEVDERKLALLPAVEAGTATLDLADITARECERAGQSSACRVEGQQHEADRRREQRPRILPADRRCGSTG